MKFLIEGNIIKGATVREAPRAFAIEIEAKSEKHAKELALVKIGSTTQTMGSQIRILKIEKK